MAIRVVRYSLGWNPRDNVGRITLVDEGGESIKLQLTTAAEFAAVAAVLREESVFLSKHGFIYTGAEIPEEGD